MTEKAAQIKTNAVNPKASESIETIRFQCFLFVRKPVCYGA